LEKPRTVWTRPAITVYEDGVYSAAAERHRCIRSADGTEELDDHHADPDEFTNLTAQPALEGTIPRLLRWLPPQRAPWQGGREG
jgi:hypothetical protein